jgi:hypothetical protein
MLKTLGNDYLIKSVKLVEKYLDTHDNVSLKVEMQDDSVLVYDDAVLLLNIRVAL